MQSLFSTKNCTKKILILLFAIITSQTCLFLGITIAQIPSQYSQLPIIVTLNPDNPGANQEVTVDLSSYATNLDTDPISWVLNGKNVQSGTGLKHFKFTTGKLGEISSLKILVTSSNGIVTQKNVTLHPSSVDMIWQAQSYVPPFYEGKALFAHQGSLSIVALPNLIGSNGVRIDPSKLVYKWQNNYQVQGDVSGYGKQVYVLDAPLPLDPTVISVDVSSTDGTITGHGDIVVQSESPKVLLYKNDPLVGIQFERVLQNKITLYGNEISVIAIPYFFSIPKRSDYNVGYEWTLNGQTVSGQTSSEVILRSDNQSQGDSSISVAVKHRKNIFQTGSADLTVTFGQTQQNTPVSF